MQVKIIGAGLAGCEAAWQLARRGIPVTLYEQKPLRHSPVHVLPGFGELVCSNSLRSTRPETGAGLLQAELTVMGSLVMEAAMVSRVPAGVALAVDRNLFSDYITQKIQQHPLITVCREEVTDLAHDGPMIVASGPLTDGPLAEAIAALTGGEGLHFFDAVAPIVSLDSVDMDHAFRAARYGEGEEDYVNCPLTRREYEDFVRALVSAQVAPVHGDEAGVKVFEGCMPVEIMAARGIQTLAFGPMSPKGLIDPATGSRPYAVLQLRQDDAAGSLANLVGFQTRLTFPEQRRVFGMVPALAHAEYVRYGVMHRNTYLNSPSLLNSRYAMKNDPDLIFAGQMTGVEGYIESAGSGLVGGMYLAHRLLGKEIPLLPQTTLLGAMAGYISNPSIVKLVPMNANMGLLEPLPVQIRDKKERFRRLSLRALEDIRAYQKQILPMESQGGNHAI